VTTEQSGYDPVELSRFASIYGDCFGSGVVVSSRSQTGERQRGWRLRRILGFGGWFRVRMRLFLRTKVHDSLESEVRVMERGRMWKQERIGPL
jgi:hypothetical protein